MTREDYSPSSKNAAGRDNRRRIHGLEVEARVDSPDGIRRGYGHIRTDTPAKADQGKEKKKRKRNCAPAFRPSGGARPRRRRTDLIHSHPRAT